MVRAPHDARQPRRERTPGRSHSAGGPRSTAESPRTGLLPVAAGIPLRALLRVNVRFRQHRICRRKSRDSYAPIATSLDQLIGKGEHLRIKFEPKRFGGLRLITKSNLVDRMTGRSAGFSPLRIRPA